MSIYPRGHEPKTYFATAHVHRLDDGTWEVTATADKPYLVTAPTEDEVKAAFVEYFYAEYTKSNPDAFSEPLTMDQVDWTS